MEQSDIPDTEHFIAEDQLWAFLKATQSDTPSALARICPVLLPKVTHPAGRAKERLARGNAVFWRAPNAIAG